MLIRTHKGGNTVVLGIYSDEKTALKEMDYIVQFFTENPTGIYQMR